MYHSTSSRRTSTFTVRGIIGIKARTFRDLGSPHKYTKIRWQIGKCEQSGRSEDRCARKRGPTLKKLHHARRVAASERRASVSY